MIQKIRNLLNKFTGKNNDQRVINNNNFDSYFNAGLDFGDAVSCLGGMGKCLNFEELFQEWKKQEKIYLEQGYEPISIDDFSDCAAFGRDIEALKYKKSESKILHSDIFEIFWLHEKYIGGAFLAMEKKEVISGSWIFPTTKNIHIQEKYKELRELFPTAEPSQIKELYKQYRSTIK